MINATLERALAGRARSTLCAIRLLLSWSRGAGPLAAEARLKLARFETREGKSVIDEVRPDAQSNAGPRDKHLLGNLRRIVDEYLPAIDQSPDIEKSIRGLLQEKIVVGFIADRTVDRKAYLTVDGSPDGFDEVLAQLVDRLPMEFWPIAEALARTLRAKSSAQPVADDLIQLMPK